MARKSRRQRDLSISPNRSLTELLHIPLRPPPVLIPVHIPSRPVVLATGDRRRYRPDASTRPPHALTASAARVVARPDPSHPGALAFKHPPHVAICVRRKQRREVLFALKKTRKGAGAKRKRNFWSDISC